MNSSATIEITSRGDGRMTSLTRPGGGECELVYDSAGRPIVRRERVDGQWLFARREVVGIGQIIKGDPPPAEPFPGHPGRLTRG